MSSFDNKDLFIFYQNQEPEVTSTTVNWRIHNLIQHGVISRIGKGKFQLGKKKEYVPELSSKLIKGYKVLKKQYPFLSVCVWNSSLLNEFMLHQPYKFYFLAEVEKDALESVFYFLKDQKYTAFLEPTEEILSRYADDDKDIWIVKSLVSEAPTQQVNHVETTSIEKILVDIFCDDKIFTAQQGAEMRTIFREAKVKYTINESKMLRYADRRRKKKELTEYLKTII